MPKSKHFTFCQYCGKKYTCGDCITNNCELGHNRESCPGYQKYLDFLNDIPKLKLEIKNKQLRDKLRYLFYFRFPAGHKFCDDLYDLDFETWKEIHTILEKNKEFRDN